MLQIKEYVKVTSLDQAYELNQKKTSVIIGGMHWLKMATRNVGTAIDLSGLGLDRIEETEEAFEIGCMTSLRQLEQHEGLNAFAGNALRDAVKDIVGIQFRNTATVGGSLYGRYGFSDVLTAFLALDSYVLCHKAGLIPLAQYARQGFDRDILVKVIVKKTPTRAAYLAQRHARTDFPILTCCVGCVDGQWRAVLGARPARAEMVPDQEGILAGGVTEDSARAFGAYVAEQLSFGTNLRGSGDYRRQIAPVLIKRALLAAGKE